MDVRPLSFERSGSLGEDGRQSPDDLCGQPLVFSHQTLHQVKRLLLASFLQGCHDPQVCLGLEEIQLQGHEGGGLRQGLGVELGHTDAVKVWWQLNLSTSATGMRI